MSICRCVGSRWLPPRTTVTCLAADPTDVRVWRALEHCTDGLAAQPLRLLWVWWRRLSTRDSHLSAISEATLRSMSFRRSASSAGARSSACRKQEAAGIYGHPAVCYACCRGSKAGPPTAGAVAGAEIATSQIHPCISSTRQSPRRAAAAKLTGAMHQCIQGHPKPRLFTVSADVPATLMPRPRTKPAMGRNTNHTLESEGVGFHRQRGCAGDADTQVADEAGQEARLRCGLVARCSCRRNLIVVLQMWQPKMFAVLCMTRSLSSR